MNRTRITGGLIVLAAAAAAVAVACGGGGGGKGGGSSSTSERPGTVVEALAVSGCDRGWVRPESVSDAYNAALASWDVKLFALYRPKDTSDTYDGGFGSQYVVVLSGARGGVALHVKSGRVTWIERACKSIDDLVAGSRVDSFVIAPAAGAASAAGPKTPPTTGMPEVDHVVDAALGANVIELASLAGYQRVACVSSGSAAGPPCHADASSVDATP